MRSLILFLLNFGPAIALQNPLQYAYDYEVSVATGMPEIHDQVAGFGYRGRMVVQVQKDGSAHIQLKDPARREFHGVRKCTSDHISGKYHPSPERIARKISVPFLAHLFDGKDAAVELPLDNILAMANMKKAVVASLKNELLNSNFEETSGTGTVADKIKRGDVPPVFTVKEETMLGICDAHYTVQKIPGILAGARDRELKNGMEVDIQRKGDQATSLEYRSKKSKTSKKHSSKSTKKTSKKYSSKTKSGRPAKFSVKIPDITDDLWRVVRTIDFDHCEESVYFQRTPIAIDKPLNGNQYDSLRGRSSVTEYILRGSGGAFRIERIDTKGAITMNPNNNELMQTTTNLKAKLVSVDQVSELFPLSSGTRTIKTWMQEFFSPYEEPKISKHVPWVTYTGKGEKMRYREVLLGYEPQKQELEMKKGVVKRMIEQYAKAMVDADGQNNISPETLMKKMQLVWTFTRELSKEQLTEVADHFMNMGSKDWQFMAKLLTVDIYAASGAPFPTQIILQYLKEGKLLRMQQLMLIVTLFQNQESPLMLPQFMDFVIELDLDDYPNVGSMGIINLASALHHFCINPKAPFVYYAGQLHGDIHCKKMIKEKFAPFLKGLIQEDNPTWKKILGVFAIQELRTPFAFEILSPVVEGKYGRDIRLRKFAIRGLNRWNHPQIVRNQVMTFLSGIYSNNAVHPYLRQEALAAFATWGPEAHFWHKLARSTWREPSKEVSAFAAKLIKAYASNKDPRFLKQSQAATQAAKISRPAQLDFSSFSDMILDFHQNDDTNVDTLFIYRNSFSEYSNSVTNQGILKASQNGFKLHLISILFDMTDRIRSPYSMSSIFEDGSIERRIAAKFYDEIQETIGTEILENNFFGSPNSVLAFIRIFKHIHIYVPIERDILFRTKSGAKYPDIETDAFFKFVLGKYFHPVEGKLVLPTEIGAPCVSHISHSVSFAMNVVNKGYDFETYIKLLSQVSSSMTVPAGPLDLIIGTSTKSTRMINLPMDFKEPYQRDPKIGIEFAYKSKFSPLIGQNTPTTFIGPLFFSPETARVYDEKIIQPFEPKAVAMPFSSLGIHHELLWKSQLNSPMELMTGPCDFPSVYELLNSKTAKRWELELQVDPQKSKTNRVDIEFGAVYLPREDNVFRAEPISGMGQVSGQDDFGQYGQETSDFNQEMGSEYSDVGQFGQTVDAEIEPVSAYEETTLKDAFSSITINDTDSEVREKLKSFRDEIYGGSLPYTHIATRGKDGDVEYKFYLALIASRETETRKKNSFYLAFLKGSSYKEVQNNKVCLEFTMESPKFPPLTTLESALSSKLNSKLTASVTEECKGEPVIFLKREASISSEAAHHIGKQLEKESREPFIVPQAYMYFPIVGLDLPKLIDSNFIYSDVDYEINWQKVSDPSKFVILPKLTSAFEFASSLSSKQDICSHQDTPGQLSVNLHRCHHYGEWSYKIGAMKNPVTISDPDYNLLLDFLNSVGDTSNIVDYAPSALGGKCFISKDQVVDLKGNSYEFKPTDCWTVAAMDCANSDSWMVLVRKSSTESNIPEVRYINKHAGVVVDLGRDARVNGRVVEFFTEKEEVIKDSFFNSVTLYKKKGNYLIEIGNSIRIAVTDRLIIEPSSRQARFVCGLCGSVSLDYDIDGIGPHKCHYSDPNLFAAAWTGRSDKCGFYSLLEHREDVEKYQQTCTHYGELINATLNAHREHGLLFDWLIRKGDENHHCVSQMPLAHCKGGFEPVSESATTVEFACYKNDRLPENISTAISKNLHFIRDPTEERPYQTFKASIDLPDSCAKVLKR